MAWPEQLLLRPRREITDNDNDIRRTYGGAVRSVAAGADQRCLLCPAQSGPGGHLRPAAHHQLHPWSTVHARRLCRPVAAAPSEYRLLGRTAAGAADRRYPGGTDRALPR